MIKKVFLASIKNKYLPAKTFSRTVFSLCFCLTVTPGPVQLASIDTIFSQCLEKCAGLNVSVSIFFIPLKFFSSFSVDFHIWTTCHLLYQSSPIKTNGRPVRDMFCNLQEQLIGNSFLGAVSTCRLTISFDGYR